MAGALSKPNKNSISVSNGESPIRSLQSDVNRLFNDFFGDFTWPSFERGLAPMPAVDITTTDDHYAIAAEIPGLDAKAIHLSIADGYVTIKGEKSQHGKSETKGYVRQERSFGSFQRVIGLPQDADPDAASAELQNGVLTVTIKRKGQNGAQAKQINIREVA